MALSLFFYDLETSGISPREARIMQFAGRRTDLNMKPIGEPYNYLIKMTPDILPDPEAILLTGITPQATIADGLTEAEFLKIFTKDIATAETVFVGYNTIRFDDEFMRFLHYRNFYDAYEWHWADKRGRWDLLDVVRMTRALRPDGIKWPVDDNGKATNTLVGLSTMNDLEHSHAHDALSDVDATIALAALLQAQQPKLFEYLFAHRDKKSVEQLVLNDKPFVYTSGKYPAEFDKTTVVQSVCSHEKKGGAVVYDLRHDPIPFTKMSPKELADMWQHYCREWPCPHPKLPVKTLQFNRCPAVAPISVLNDDNQKHIGLSIDTINKNLAILNANPEFKNNISKAVVLMDDKRQASSAQQEPVDVDNQLYDGFVSAAGDKTSMSVIRASSLLDIAELEPAFKDQRLNNLLPLYKARNYPSELSTDDIIKWDEFRQQRLLGAGNSSRAAKYFEKLGKLAEGSNLTPERQFILEELQLYGQSVLPTID
ncbi:MAG: exodeoxyribonuclease I [Candidatus Saccharimonadales bacterium]